MKLVVYVFVENRWIDNDIVTQWGYYMIDVTFINQLYRHEKNAPIMQTRYVDIIDTHMLGCNYFSSL